MILNIDQSFFPKILILWQPTCFHFALSDKIKENIWKWKNQISITWYI